MALMIMRTLLAFFFPGSLLLLAAILCVNVEEFSVWAPAVSRLYPYAVFTGAVLLGWRFNRSRLVFGALSLFLADRFLFFIDPHVPSHQIALDAAALLLPLNFIALSFMKERGIFTAHGIMRFGFILFQPAAVALLYYYQYPAIGEYLDFPIVKDPPVDISLSQPSLLAFGLALSVLAFRFLRNRDSLEHGYFWALAAVIFALIEPERRVFAIIYLSTASLILVVSAIEAAYGMAFRDELTRLPARRALNESLLKLGSVYTIAMLDIDFFKKFNDRYGHDVGDQVLRMVASKMAKTTGGGRPFRYGGEEFTILFSGKTVEEALPHLEKLRETIAASGFSIRGLNRPKRKPKGRARKRGSQKKVSVTISIGVAASGAGQTLPQQVIKAADKALYRAKNGGRNRVST